jgi:predicted  nucleic acid-binding Zn-ribbon protein
MGQGEIVLSSHVEGLRKHLSAFSKRKHFSNAQMLILQKAHATIEAKNKERDAASAKIELLETKLSERQQKVEKLEEEVVRLRRAVEESMTRLKSLSSDSDNHVDRRIVIKLLVTYFQKNHSREVRSSLLINAEQYFSVTEIDMSDFRNIHCRWKLLLNKTKVHE